MLHSGNQRPKQLLGQAFTPGNRCIGTGSTHVVSQTDFHDGHNRRQAHHDWLQVHVEHCRSGRFARLARGRSSYQHEGVYIGHGALL
jgi:hypothetical protein